MVKKPGVASHRDFWAETLKWNVPRPVLSFPSPGESGWPQGAGVPKTGGFPGDVGAVLQGPALLPHRKRQH